MKKKVLTVCLLSLILVSGCANKNQVMDGDDMPQTFQYTEISQDEAMQMMQLQDGHVIVDVRREDEYDEGHIPGAILIPNESITDTPPAELPDLEQIILVYCRSGRRSKEAAQKLADMGYENVYEFGGIIDWTGDIITDEEVDSTLGSSTAELRFDSFDGGGPEYDVEISDESIVSCDIRKEYYDPDHEEMDGAGYDVIVTFTGKKPGETTIFVNENSPIGDSFDMQYRVTVNENLEVHLEEM